MTDTVSINPLLAIKAAILEDSRLQVLARVLLSSTEVDDRSVSSSGRTSLLRSHRRQSLCSGHPKTAAEVARPEYLRRFNGALREHRMAAASSDEWRTLRQGCSSDAHGSGTSQRRAPINLRRSGGSDDGSRHNAATGVGRTTPLRGSRGCRPHVEILRIRTAGLA